MKWPMNEQGSNNTEEDAQMLMFSFNSICPLENFSLLHHHKSSKQDKINLFINKIKITKLNSKALTNQEEDPAHC